MLARLGTCCVLIALLAAPSFAKDDEEKVDKADKVKEDKNSVPEIAPIAAGAIGLCVVGGLALLTTRRRPASVTSDGRD